MFATMQQYMQTGRMQYALTIYIISTKRATTLGCPYNATNYGKWETPKI
jgi:Na+/melibiose symporter-like transporter